MNDAADHSSVIHAGLTTSVSGKVLPQLRELLVGQPEMIPIHPCPAFGGREPYQTARRNPFMGPDPRINLKRSTAKGRLSNVLGQNRTFRIRPLSGIVLRRFPLSANQGRGEPTWAIQYTRMPAAGAQPGMPEGGSAPSVRSLRSKSGQSASSLIARDESAIKPVRSFNRQQASRL